IFLFILSVRHLVNFLSVTLPVYLQITEINVAYTEVILIVGIPVLLLLTGSVVLWVFAEKLSKLLLPNSSRDYEVLLRSKEIEGFVLSVIGLVIAILSFTKLVGMTMNYINIVSKEIQFPWEGNAY